MAAPRGQRRVTPRSPLARAFAWAALAFGVFLVVFGALAAFRLSQVARDLRTARTQLQASGTAVEQGRLADARAGLAKAQNMLISANDRLYQSSSLDLVGWVPFVHENLASLRHSVGLALTLAAGGNRLLQVATPLQDSAGKLEVPLRSGRIPLDTVLQAQREADALASALPARSEQPSDSLLLGPVSDLQDKVFAEAAKRRSQLDAVSRGLALLADMSGANGPRRYLIAVANTAEMRGSGGMILSYGELTSEEGDFGLGPFGSVDEIPLSVGVDPTALALPGDFVRRWAGLQPTELWRNANLNPDFTLMAPVMEAMFTQATALPVDGVIQIDPQGLAAIVEGIGPVDVPNVGRVNADNMVSYTLNEAYTQFPDRDERQDVLADVAKVVFAKLVTGQYSSLRPLAEAIARAATERHILFHTVHNGAQDQSRFFKADGGLPGPETQDYAVMTVQNLSRNKLDYYLDTTLRLDGDRPVGEPGTVTATVVLQNTAPVADGPKVIFGPYDASQVLGQYKGTVSLYLPNGVTLERSSGDPTTSGVALTTEAGRTVVTFGMDVPTGATKTVTMDLRFPPRPATPYGLVLIAMPRVRPTVVDVDINTGSGVARREGPLETSQVVLAQ